MDSDDLRSDERHEDISKDDAPVQGKKSHTGELEWAIHSAGRSTDGSDVSLLDFRKLSIHSKKPTIVHLDGQQFIERRDSDDGLPYSAEFHLGDEVWKLNGEDCLLMSNSQYFAKVSVEGMVDLDGAVDFSEAVQRLQSKLKVVNVFMDEQLQEHNKAKSVVKMLLNKLADGLKEHNDYRQDVMLMHMLLKKHCNSLNINFKLDLMNCSSLSSDIKLTFDNYVTMALKLTKRNETLAHLNNFPLSDQFVNEAIQEALNGHRTRLAAVCPSTMEDKFKKLDDDHILLITTDDMNLFNDLSTLGQAIFEPVLEIIFCKFLTRIEQIVEDDQLADVGPLTNRIFLYVCKSLLQVAEQHGAHINTDNIIVYTEEHGWAVTHPQGQSQTSYSKGLREQLQMLAMLANHFEPGGPFRTSRFPYEFKLFQDMDTIPEQVRIWLCILDDSMKDEILADFDKMQMLSCFFKSYMSFVSSEDFQSETFECLRMITHDTLRSLTGMESTQHERISMDSALLECNDMIGSCLENFPRKHFENEIDQIQATLQRIICQAMNKNAPPAFSNAFKNLLTDLSDLQLEWFIRLPPSEDRSLLLRKMFIVPVDNLWKDTEHECFKIVNLEAFLKMYKLLYEGADTPKHYQLNVVHEFLQYLDELMTKQHWKGENPISDKDQMDAMTTLINSMRRSILNLTEQPDFTCFEKFLQLISEPFSEAVEESTSLEDFCNRIISRMNDCKARNFPYSDAIDDEETMALFPDLFDGSISAVQFRNNYIRYTTQFEKYITETGLLTREDRIKRIVSEVQLKVEPQLAIDWTEAFKQNTLPNVLAGLSAVWSIIVSNIDGNLEKLEKPTCLQITCILNYLNGQNHYEDDRYRLLYLSTQQGKDLVLGLIAAFLALYGHKVQIACYNSNLWRRNSTDLLELFRSFSIYSEISYGSLNDMAREQSKGVYEKYAAYIYECLGIEIHSKKQPQVASEDEKSVLLIDDIDILCLRKTLGNAFERLVAPTIPGLELIHEKVCNSQKISSEEIEKFIEQSDHPQMCKLRAFLARAQSFTILDGHPLQEEEYTNRKLFNKHMQLIFTTHFLSVPKLTRDGVFMTKFLSKFRVCDVIPYFNLKDIQQTVKGYKNYGYLPLALLAFPYASLVKSFPLVLGFGSVPLKECEELNLEYQYGIFNKIAKSNPFNSSAVKFDCCEDFLCVEWHLQWMAAIMVAIKVATKRNDSVLVFFQSVIEMQKFQSEFGLQLKRLSVTVFETASNGKNLCEDEFAVEEVTVLVVEAKDRSDYEPEDRKVHVIQTFYSDDSKEENLIRRFAERRQSSGSFKIIVKLYDLPSCIYDNELVTYSLFVSERMPECTYHEAKTKLNDVIERYEKIKTFCEKF